MTTSDGSWSPQIRTIGDLERPDHWWLKPEHNCYFFGEYTARAGYSHSSTNQIIANLKKKPSTYNTSQWPHKIKAMRRIATAVKGAINPAAIGSITVIPIPPSKARGDPEYDSRMAEIARAVAPDAREAIETDASRCAMHENDERMRPDEMVGTLILNHALCHPAPREIILLDDVITTGCSFVACYTILREQFPDVPISGIFAARRIISNANATDDFADLDLEF